MKVTKSPAIDARRPDSVYATNLARRIGTPDMYAAISEDPTAYAARPITERLKGSHTIKTTRSNTTRLAGAPPGIWPVSASASAVLTSQPGTGLSASAAP